MVAEISTAFSDAVLALSAFHSSYHLLAESYCGFVGFLLVGFAASAGAIRFGSRYPSRDLIGAHMYLSWLASVLGTSLLAAAYHRQATLYQVANAHLAAALTLTLLSSLFSDKIHHMISEGVSSSAVLSLLILSIFNFSPFGVIGAVVYIVAGLVIGTRGSWLGLPRVDWFHYALLIGNVALMLGIKYKDGPIYYRPSTKP